MAIDEALLEVIRAPLLRVYRWRSPAVSFGYFEHWAPVRDAHPGRDAVRRWTGGGVVPHGGDFTYSLLIPRDAVAPGTPGESYCAIHTALRGALAEAGIHALEAAVPAAPRSHACFENPVRHDVLVAGRKVAGAAQRRTRAGLLHQGSVQGVDLPEGFPTTLAGRLAAVVRAETWDVTDPAEELAAWKYGSRAWLERW